jgi:L-threonylcarbamoyladenylate synthase
MFVTKSLSDKKLIEAIRGGGVGVLPTDTVYGLVCRAADETAVASLYKLKDRLGDKPGTVIAASIDQLVELGVTARYLKAVEQFWPNPISIIIPVHEHLFYLSQGLRTLPFRIVKDKQLRDLLEKVGPLLTTSANHPGRSPANTVEESQKYFDDSAEFYVDGGDLSGNKPSTIIKVIDDAIELVRPGAVDIDEEGRIANKH